MTAPTATRPEFSLPKLNPKQRQVFDFIREGAPGSYSICLFGGAVGGSKTHCLARVAIQLSTEFPGNRIVLGRSEFNKLKTTTMEEFYKFCPPSIIKRRNDTDNYCKIRLPHWPEGVESTVFFRGFDNWEGFGSEQFGAVLIDEASEVSRNSAIILLVRLRHPLPNVVKDAMEVRGMGMKYVFMATSNPYPGWFADWAQGSLDEVLDLVPGARFKFIPSHIRDNAENLPKNYEEMARAALESELGKDMAERLIDGRFDVFMGQVWPNFDARIHKWLGPIPRPKEDYVRVIGGMDFGGEKLTSHFSAAIVGVVLKSGRIIQVAEFKDKGPGVDDRLLSWVMAQNERWARPMNKKIEWCADKSQMFGINTWRNMGMSIRKSSGMKVEESVKIPMRYFAKDDSGIPGIFYLPELKHFESDCRKYHWPRNEDGLDKPSARKPVQVDDDLASAFRYQLELVVNFGGDPAQLLKNQLPVVI